MKHIAYIKNPVSWEEEFSFYIPIKIRFSETDMFGHMNNVSPFIYFEEARIEYFKQIGLFNDFSKSDVVPVVADLQCDYIEQIFFDDVIDLYVKANRVGTSSLDIHYMAKNKAGRICLTGRGSVVHINKHTGKAMPLEEADKEKIYALQN